MDSRTGLDRWALAAGAVLLSVGVAFFAYNAGAAHALAASPVPMVQAVPGAVAVYGFYHPWGFGPFFPLFFLVFWFVALRVLIGRRRWRGAARILWVRRGWCPADVRGVAPAGACTGDPAAGPDLT